MTLVPSLTRSLVPSGTQASCHQEPIWVVTDCSGAAICLPNYANFESYGFNLTQNQCPLRVAAQGDRA